MRHNQRHNSPNNEHSVNVTSFFCGTKHQEKLGFFFVHIMEVNDCQFASIWNIYVYFKFRLSIFLVKNLAYYDILASSHAIHLLTWKYPQIHKMHFFHRKEPYYIEGPSCPSLWEHKFNHHVWPLLQLCIHTRWVAAADIRVIEEEKPQSTICIISVNISSPREAILIILCTNPLPSLCHMLTSTSLKQFLWWLDDIVI